MVLPSPLPRDDCHDDHEFNHDHHGTTNETAFLPCLADHEHRLIHSLTGADRAWKLILWSPAAVLFDLLCSAFFMFPPPFPDACDTLSRP